jgi:Icc-related predicted phosphoesterase
MSQGNLGLIKEAFLEITTPGEERYEKILPMIEEEYEKLASFLPEKTYIIYGNDDYPDILREKIAGRAEVIDAGVVTVNGIDVALVSGMPGGDHIPQFPGIVPAEEYDEMFTGLGKADIVITHIPPHQDGGGNENPDPKKLTYDTIAKRNEPSSTAITDYIRKHDPAYSFFGHVHNPNVVTAEIAKTKAVNLGFFRAKKEVTRLNVKTMEYKKVGL